LRTVAFLPIRGGSKSIPHKNVKEICGKRLFVWAMEAAAQCNLIDTVYLGIDSDYIWDIASEYVSDKVDLFRTKHMDDYCMQETPMLELANYVDFDTIVLLQATQPLTTSKDLQLALIKHSNYGSIVSVCRQHKFFWSNDGIPLNYTPSARLRRQEWGGVLIENGAFFITPKKLLLESKCRISGDIGVFEMDPDTYFEIDTPADWGIMEGLLKKRRS